MRGIPRGKKQGREFAHQCKIPFQLIALYWQVSKFSREKNFSIVNYKFKQILQQEGWHEKLVELTRQYSTGTIHSIFAFTSLSYAIAFFSIKKFLYSNDGNGLFGIIPRTFIWLSAIGCLLTGIAALMAHIAEFFILRKIGKMEILPDENEKPRK